MTEKQSVPLSLIKENNLKIGRAVRDTKRAVTGRGLD